MKSVTSTTSTTTNPITLKLLLRVLKRSRKELRSAADYLSFNYYLGAVSMLTGIIGNMQQELIDRDISVNQRDYDKLYVRQSAEMKHWEKSQTKSKSK